MCLLDCESIVTIQGISLATKANLAHLLVVYPEGAAVGMVNSRQLRETTVTQSCNILHGFNDCLRCRQRTSYQEKPVHRLRPARTRPGNGTSCRSKAA